MAERKAPARKPRTVAPVQEPTVAETVEVEAAPHPTPPDHPGFVGHAPDPTPNEHYTLSGVIADKPVPEHDR